MCLAQTYEKGLKMSEPEQFSFENSKKYLKKNCIFFSTTGKKNSKNPTYLIFIQKNDFNHLLTRKKKKDTIPLSKSL